MLHQGGVRRRRVEPAGRRHDVGGHAGEGLVLQAGPGPAVDRRPPAGQADEQDQAGSEPLRPAAAPARRRPTYSARPQGGGRGRGPLDQVGHAHVVDVEGVEGVLGPADQARFQRRPPEPVGGPGEAEAGVGRHQARVEAAHQHVHVGPDGVGQGAGPPGLDPHAVALRRHALHVEAGPGDHRRHLVRLPAGEEAAGKVHVLAGADDPLAVAPPQAHGEGGADLHRPLEAGQGLRQAAFGQVEVAVARPRPAQRAVAEGEDGEVGLHRPPGAGVPGQGEHGRRQVERRPRRRPGRPRSSPARSRGRGPAGRGGSGRRGPRPGPGGGAGAAAGSRPPAARRPRRVRRVGRHPTSCGPGHDRGGDGGRGRGQRRRLAGGDAGAEGQGRLEGPGQPRQDQRAVAGVGAGVDRDPGGQLDRGPPDPLGVGLHPRGPGPVDEVRREHADLVGAPGDRRVQGGADGGDDPHGRAPGEELQLAEALGHLGRHGGGGGVADGRGARALGQEPGPGRSRRRRPGGGHRALRRPPGEGPGRRVDRLGESRQR